MMLRLINLQIKDFLSRDVDTSILLECYYTALDLKKGLQGYPELLVSPEFATLETNIESLRQYLSLTQDASKIIK